MIVEFENPIESVVCITDSIGWGSKFDRASGWIVRLQKLLCPWDVKLYSPGVNSQGSYSTLQRLEKKHPKGQTYESLFDKKPTHAFVAVGLHDTNPLNGTPYQTPQQYGENIRRITNNIRARGVEVMWLNVTKTAMTPIQDPNDPSKTWDVNKTIKQYNDQLIMLNVELEVAHYSIGGLQFHPDGSQRYVWRDGVHFMPESVELQAQDLSAYVIPRTKRGKDGSGPLW